MAGSPPIPPLGETLILIHSIKTEDEYIAMSTSMGRTTEKKSEYSRQFNLCNVVHEDSILNLEDGILEWRAKVFDCRVKNEHFFLF